MSDRYRGMREANARRHATRRAEIESGSWDCKNCGRHLPAVEFSPTYNNRAYPGARRTTCKLCEVVRKYGMTGRQWLALLDSQGGVCAVCGEIAQRWTTDHDHSCCPGVRSCGDCVRAILCKWMQRSRGVLANPGECSATSRLHGLQGGRRLAAHEVDNVRTERQ